MNTINKELSVLLNDPRLDEHQKDMFRLALFLMAKAGNNDGMEALIAGDEDMLIQLVKDHFMKGIPEERRRVAEEAVNLFHKAGTGAHFQVAHDIQMAMRGYQEIYRFTPGAYIDYDDISLKATLWLSGYIAGIRHERKRRRTT